MAGCSIYLVQCPLQFPRDSICSIPFFPPPRAPQGDALEQGHHPKSLRGLHPQVAEGATALQRPGEPAEIPGASQPQPAAPNPGLEGRGSIRGGGGGLPKAETEEEEARISPLGIFGGSPGFLTHMLMMMTIISSDHNVLALSCFSHVRLCDSMDCSPPGSSVHGILQARILEWVAMPSSRGSSPPRARTQVSYVSCISRWILY